MATMEKKAMLGPKVRRLRRDQGLTQAQMADQLGISPSYLNLIEHNQRPVTVPLLLKLGQQFGVDLQAFAEDEESRLVAGLREVFADPLFDGSDIKNQDFRELAAVAPTLGQAVVALYRGFRGARDDLQALAERVADREKLHLVQATGFPQDEVRDLFQAHSNHFPDLEAAAESLWQDGKLERGDLYRGLVDWLNTQHSVRVRLLPSERLLEGNGASCDRGRRPPMYRTRIQFSSISYSPNHVLMDGTFLVVMDEDFVIRLDETLNSPFIDNRPDLFALDFDQIEPILDEASRREKEPGFNDVQFIYDRVTDLVLSLPKPTPH